jgi:hypothetical protein
LRTRQEIKSVLDLHARGLNNSEISRTTGIPRGTIRDWVRGRVPGERSSTFDCTPGLCAATDLAAVRTQYVYLLGAYLGDGHISTSKKGVHRIRLVCDNKYPELRDKWTTAIAVVMPNNKVGHIKKIGCTEVYSDSKHWTCLFPQHGRGRKHERPIYLASWQQELVDIDPRPLIAGLIHSDGCRVLNPVSGRLYPRYHFTNASDDIRTIFTNSLNALGIPWTQNNPRNISIARRGAVAALDGFVSRKR